jgi:cytochrome c
MDKRFRSERTRLPTSLRLHLVLSALLSLSWLAACGGDRGGERAAEAQGASGGEELTAEQMEKGIGPITSVDLGPIDPDRVERGEEVYQLKCSACHKLDDRYVGPPLRDVTERRTPEFILNMLLNSWEMTQRHPTVRDLLAEYYTPMPDQDLSEEDARAVLDYLRNAAKEGGDSG